MTAFQEYFRKIPLLLSALAVLAAVFLPACDDEVEVNAEEKDILVVYGVLNPQQPTQYIRVAKAFLTDGDAIQFAQQNDLSVRNANVVLTDGEREIVFQPVDTTTEEGEFAQEYTVFKSDEPIEANVTYYLTITLPEDEGGFAVRAHTTVPDTPSVYLPRDSSLIFGNQYAYERVAFESRLEIEWQTDRRASFENVDDPVPGRAYEVRLNLNYRALEAPGDTVPMNATYGPFTGIQDDVQSGDCNSSDGRVCYRIQEGAFLAAMQTKLPPDKKLYYDDSFFGQSLSIEVTAVDTFLYDYTRVNDPAFSDFTTVRPEYTNIEAIGEGDAVGIFGAINVDKQWVHMSACSEAVLNFNDTQRPPDCNYE